ncbi:MULTISPECIES: hypothetical protein [unclassified Streptomyces]|uniref:hypothetical protein n=1 Tax=unclassified Streptomyces TaxID=2593676 RepID=UPI0036640792
MPPPLKEKLAPLLPEGFKTWAKEEAGTDASPAQLLELWHVYCASVVFPEHNAEEEDLEGVAAVQAYIDAAAEAGIHRPKAESLTSATRMHGCGARREKNSTYRWTYDGTHIHGADSQTVPADRTYWTDQDGFLVGKSKGGPGQSWTLAPWKPAETPSDPVQAIALTGLFGPLAGLLGN